MDSSSMQRINGFARLTGDALGETFGKVAGPWPEEKSRRRRREFPLPKFIFAVYSSGVNTGNTVRVKRKMHDLWMTQPAGD
jgi:hypothetical protein